MATQDPCLATISRHWTEVSDCDLPPLGDTGGLTAEQAVEACRTSPQPDPLLVHLIDAAQSGSRLAGWVLLEVAMPWLQKLARHDDRLTVSTLVAAVWVRIGRYRVGPKGTSVLMTLVLGARRDVLAELQPLGCLHHVQRRRLALASAVLDRAEGLGIIEAKYRVVVECVYVEGLTSDEAAARHRLTPATVRWRCSTALKRMAARSHELAGP